MQWQGQAIIIDVLKYSESSLIITLLSEDKGIFKTMIRGGVKKFAILQIGNLITGVWKARLEEQLGSFTNIESIRNYNALFLNSKLKLLALKTMTETISLSTMVGEEHPRIYQNMIVFLDHLLDEDLSVVNYLHYELCFLRDIGFGIDITHCAVTGEKDNLYYISPRTGHAVTKEVGKKYHDKLLIIPSFLHDQKISSLSELKDSFNFLSYFLKKHLFLPHNKEIPYIRSILEQEFAKNY